MAEVAVARRRQHASPETRRAQILEAALSCFAAKGYHAATMDDLVRASGLSKGSLYWHFDGKEAVFLALLDALTEEIFGAWDDAAADGGDRLDLVLRQVAVTADSLGGQRPMLLAWSEFLSHPRGRERLGEVYVETRRRLEELLRAGMQQGEVRALPVASAAVSVISAVEGLFLQALVDDRFDPKCHSETLCSMLRKGLEP